MAFDVDISHHITGATEPSIDQCYHVVKANSCLS